MHGSCLARRVIVWNTELFHFKYFHCEFKLLFACPTFFLGGVTETICGHVVLIKMGNKTEEVTKGKKYGGTTCCVPLCRSNSVKNPELSFHNFP
jgi:hypothetical protein